MNQARSSSMIWKMQDIKDICKGNHRVRVIFPEDYQNHFQKYPICLCLQIFHYKFTSIIGFSEIIELLTFYCLKK